MSDFADQQPFYRKKLRQEGEYNPVISVRLNEEERLMLEEIKAVFDIEADSAALKLVAFKGWGILQRTFGREDLRWLADKDRTTRGVKYVHN